MPGKSHQEKLDTVLVRMAAIGNAKKVAELLSQGGRVDARDQGFTPLLLSLATLRFANCCWRKAKPTLRRQGQRDLL